MGHTLSEELRKLAGDVNDGLMLQQYVVIDALRRAADALDEAQQHQQSPGTLARIEAAEAERDELRRQLDDTLTLKDVEGLQERAERAEAQAARYREALKEISNGGWCSQVDMIIGAYCPTCIADEALREPT